MKALATIFESEAMPPLQNVFLDDETHAKALDRYINVCTDVVLVDEQNCFVLANRKVSAAQGWWWKGGGMRKGESPEESVDRLMKREIGFSLEGVTLLDIFFHQWCERKSPPSENGQHDLIMLHYARVSEETISRITLDPTEYDPNLGFIRYDGSQSVRPVIAHAYKLYLQR